MLFILTILKEKKEKEMQKYSAQVHRRQVAEQSSPGVSFTKCNDTKLQCCRHCYLVFISQKQQKSHNFWELPEWSSFCN